MLPLKDFLDIASHRIGRHPPARVEPKGWFGCCRTLVHHDRTQGRSVSTGLVIFSTTLVVFSTTLVVFSATLVVFSAIHVSTSAPPKYAKYAGSVPGIQCQSCKLGSSLGFGRPHVLMYIVVSTW